MRTYESFVANQIENKKLNLYRYSDFMNIKTKYILHNSITIEVENDIEFEIEELAENEIDFR